MTFATASAMKYSPSSMCHPFGDTILSAIAYHYVVTVWILSERLTQIMKNVSKKPKNDTKKKANVKQKPKLATSRGTKTTTGRSKASATKKGDVPKPSLVKKPSFPIVVFDTETTGLTRNRTVKLNKQPEVIEFYARLVDLDAGPEPLKEYYTMIRPTVEWPMTPYTIRETKTKLSNEMLKDAPTFREVADPIYEILAEPHAPGNLAHNLSFDRDMIEIELERLGRTIPWPIIGICTVEQTVHLRGRRMNQTALYGYLFEGKTFENAHRAKDDVGALTDIAVELRKRGII